MSVTSKLHETLRQPEYTGENRCSACTWVNSGIAVVLSAVVGVLAAIIGSIVVGVAAGGTVLSLSAGAIYFRGYLVPRTPELTMKYLPKWLLQKFSKDNMSPVEDVDLEVDPVEGLRASGALEECQDVDDLCLTEAFRRRWYDRFDRMWSQDDEIAVIAEHFGVPEEEVAVQGYKSVVPDLDELDADPDEEIAAIAPDGKGGFEAIPKDDVSDDVDEDEMPTARETGRESPPVDEMPTSPDNAKEMPTPPDNAKEMPAPPDNAEGGRQGGREPTPQYTVLVGENRPASWPSRESLFAEIAAANVLEEEWDWDQWSEIGDETKSFLLAGLRLFLDSCPSCGANLTQSEETVESCCINGEVFAVACEECDCRVFERQLPGAA